MPPTEQEQRCIDLACRWLGSLRGGDWTVTKCLDDLNPSSPSPEVIVSNGEMTAAIEVKRLTGDAVQQQYTASLLSNERFLRPPCGGSYYLTPPVDFRLPMDTALRNRVRQEIARVAPTLAPGEEGAIRIPRGGHVSLASASGPGYVSCLHQGPHSEIMARVSDRLTRMFMLVDEGLEHSFVTREVEKAFEDAVVAACERLLQGVTGPFTWDEEWGLTRVDDKNDGDTDGGVWIIAVTEARSMPESVKECVRAVLSKAMPKFRGKRWATFHMIVLESSPAAPALLAAHAVQEFRSADQELIDHFLLVDGGEVSEASALVDADARAAAADEERSRLQVVESPISGERVERFRADYLKGRREIGAVEKVFSRASAFEHRIGNKETATFGFNGFVHKGPFVDGSNWADLSAWQFAVAEERHLLGKLHEHLNQSTRETGQVLAEVVRREPGEILSAAGDMSKLLAKKGFEASLVVVAAALQTDTIIALQKALSVPGWDLSDDLRTNWILGLHGTCPVLYLRDDDLSSLYVLDVRQFAMLRQFEPAVDLEVEAVEERQARQILEERPDIQVDLETLLAMAHLRLYQSYDFEIYIPEAVWAAWLADPDAGSLT